MIVLLRCLQPRPDPAMPDHMKRILSNNEFKAQTDAGGWIIQEWRAGDHPETSLVDFLWVSNEICEATVWQLGFFTTEYFAPAKPRYSLVDVNLVLHRGQDSPHISLCLDLEGYGIYLERFMDAWQRTRQSRFSQSQQKALIEPSPNEPHPNQANRTRLSELSKQRTSAIRRYRAECLSTKCHQLGLRHQATNVHESAGTTSGGSNLLVTSGGQEKPINLNSGFPAEPIIVDSDQANVSIVDTEISADSVIVEDDPVDTITVDVEVPADLCGNAPASLVLRRSTRQHMKMKK